MIKKIGLGIGVLLFILTTGFYDQVHAEALNAKECIEGNAECPDLEKSTPNEFNDDDSASNSKKDQDNGFSIFTMIRMLFSLLIVLGLIYALLKFLNKRNKKFQKVTALENLGGISVGPNKSIQIVRVGSKIYLVGVGENVEMLQEVTDQEVINDLINNEPSEFQAGTLFTSLFKQKTATDEASKNEKNDFKKMFSTELDKLKKGRKKIINQYTNKEDKHE
ncbi:flagellar biosynthetic protein FliO [Virgibacillus ndiopensis]|uniref:flagellar biosynthetic protein FliO n=1 Tax=Virgibacillus ndiopensis TaxID=2004408 RepID=UPI000C07BB0A|nr:flagellar biosynthetic protein FliO [Virgibacillus ndiopensis]